MKISLSNLFNYFSVSEDSKQKKNPTKKGYFDHNNLGHFVVGTTQKYHFFDAAPYFATPPAAFEKIWQDLMLLLYRFFDLIIDCAPK